MHNRTLFINFYQDGGNLVDLTTPGHRYCSHGPFNHWILLHLDTLFPHSSLLHASEPEQLEWADTPEQEHIAKARLACYDPLQEDEHNKRKQLEPEPHLLKLFLWSKDYAVCTIAFKWCLNLATIEQPNSAGDIHSTGIFIPEVMGHQWIEHLGQVLSRRRRYGRIRSWEFLAEHLAPKWDKLPPSWCCEFAFVFLFSNADLPDRHGQPAYQRLAGALIDVGHEQFNQAFLPFLGVLLELIIDSLNWDQLASLETWLAQFPDKFNTQDAHVKLGNVLVMQRQKMTLELFEELPMTYSELMNDAQ